MDSAIITLQIEKKKLINQHYELKIKKACPRKIAILQEQIEQHEDALKILLV